MTVRCKVYTDVSAIRMRASMQPRENKEVAMTTSRFKEKTMRNKTMWIRNSVMAAMLILAPGWAAAEITVEGAWVRMPPPVADTAAAYLILNNSGDVDINITSVETDAAGAPEFHSMSMHDGMMHMQKMEKVTVPAHGRLEFSPGSDHLMLKDLKRELEAGDHIMLKLNTSDGHSVDVHAEVRDMREMSNHTGGHHH